MKLALNPMTGSLIRQRRDVDTEQKPRGDGGRNGRGGPPGQGWTPGVPRSGKRREGHHDLRCLFSRTRSGSEGR